MIIILYYFLIISLIFVFRISPRSLTALRWGGQVRPSSSPEKAFFWFQSTACASSSLLAGTAVWADSFASRVSGWIPLSQRIRGCSVAHHRCTSRKRVMLPWVTSAETTCSYWPVCPASSIYSTSTSRISSPCCRFWGCSALFKVIAHTCPILFELLLFVILGGLWGGCCIFILPLIPFLSHSSSPTIIFPLKINYSKNQPRFLALLFHQYCRFATKA